jgi:2'-5' RNA ligase
MATPAEAHTIRAFVAIELPVEIKALLGTVQSELRDIFDEAAGAVKWVRPEGIHLTLQFLGNVSAAAVPRITESLVTSCAGRQRFSVDLGGLGVFPGLKRPRVIWVGLETSDPALPQLLALQEAVSAGLARLGFAPEKSFTAHFTLGRVRDGADARHIKAISDALSSPEDVPRFEATFDVGAVSLMRSELGPGGAEYTRLAHIALE